MTNLATIKCPFCKAKTGNPDRKTLAIYSTDTYYCFRCNATGLISDISPSQLSGITPSFKPKPSIQRLQYNNKGDRFSVCKQRYNDNTRDVFQIKLADGSLVGHYTRQPNKISHIEGVKGFCYREQYLDLGTTYRVVEGVYDCIYPNDIALLGYPNQFQANQLKWFNIILCPDGDVWKKGLEELRKWLQPFWNHKKVVTVEMCVDGLDPDECTQDKRKTFKFDYVKSYL